MARDPKRIPRICALLQWYWTRYPNLRLGQIVGNMAQGMPEYYVEDSIVEQALEHEKECYSDR